MIHRAINICRNLISGSTITDADLDNAINTLICIPGFKEIDIIQLKNELMAIYNVTVEDAKILDEKEEMEPWLREFKADRISDWHFWQRYQTYLKEFNGFSQNVVDKLDDLTDRILDRLFNPRRENIEICKKGLVVGQVQSGKTANYTGLICKAADAGFNVIVVLAGIHNNLRSQTQSRLDEGFLGFDTQAFIQKKERIIGVGNISNTKNAIAHSYTSSADKGDFSQQVAANAGINFNNPQPILFVVKKNSSVLKNLNQWLGTQGVNGKIKNKSLLIVDDEADNASINTHTIDDEPTRINGQIRNILSLFSRSAYVGYTATPFANIFIPQCDSDLFPKHFIINIPPPTNYIGPEKVFGTSANPDSDNEELLPIVNVINDYHNFVPNGHKLDDVKPCFEDIPDSLKIAVKSFIITCAIRIARGQGNKHNSMLIHVSRFQAWQNHIKDLVNDLFRYYKGCIEIEDENTLEEFREIFEIDTDEYTSFVSTTKHILDSSFATIDNKMKIHDWSEIRPLLYRAVQKIEVKSINGSSGDILTYKDNDANGISVIAIGGDKLSRGLTLEGLSVSYFLRASRMYDTLMQMGRWFGYRPGYMDLCRLFTSSELNEWYRHISLATDELREEFNYLYESGGTPANYALKVRNHPGVLQITSLTKMRYVQNIEVSWSGRLIETYQLNKDKESINANIVVTEKLLKRLNNYSHEYKGVNRLWKNIPVQMILDFLTEFRLPSSLKKVDLYMIREFIEDLCDYGELTNWSVALMSKTKDKDEDFEYTLGGFNIKAFKRRASSDSNENTYYLRKNHILGGPDEEFIDLDESLLKRAWEVSKMRDEKWDKSYPKAKIVRQEFRNPCNPLLMIYPLNPYHAYFAHEIGERDKPFISFAIAFPGSNSGRAVSYVVNQIKDFADTEDSFEQSNDNRY